MKISRTTIASVFKDAIVLLIGVPIIVFGTYGTMNGGDTSSGTIYLKFAFPAALIAISILFSLDLTKRGRLSLFAFNTFEFQLLLGIILLILVSTLRMPQFLLSACLTAVAAVFGVLFLTNHIQNQDGFSRVFKSYHLLVYVASTLALVSGLYSFYIGPFSVGPLLIEYNKAFWRVNAWYVTSTGLGLFLCQGVFSAYYFAALSGNKFAKLVHGIFSLGFIYGMALAGGRTGFIAMILAFSTLWAAKCRPTLTLIVKILVAQGMLWALVIILANMFSSEIYILRRFFGEDTVSLGGRTGFLERAISDIGHFSISELLFGLGINGVKETLNWNVSAHSGVLRFMLEYGILMLALYTLFSIHLVIGAFKTLRRSSLLKAESSVILLCIVSYVSSEIMVIQLFGISIEFLMFVAAVSFYISLKKFSSENSPSSTSPI